MRVGFIGAGGIAGRHLRSLAPEPDIEIVGHADQSLERAEAAAVPAELVARDRFDAAFDREAYSQRLVERLAAHDIDVVAMAGFGTILGRAAHDAFGGRIVNTHPALLPAFPGAHAVADALAYGVKISVVTVKIKKKGVDTGPVVAQAAVAVLPGDDEARLQRRIQDVERPLYVDAVGRLARQGFAVEGRTVTLR